MLARSSSHEQTGVPVYVWLALTIGSSLNPLNSSMVSVALVPVMRHFHISLATTSWVITSFYLAACVSLPIMGRLADQLGPSRVFPVGMTIALFASVGAALAPTFGVLILMRVLQSVGTAAAFPSAILVLRRHGRNTAPIATAGTIAAALGPVVGGLAILLGGWSAIFWLNVPLTITAGVVLAVALRGTDHAHGEITLRKLRQMLDPGGVVSFAVGVTGIVLFVLSLDGTPDWVALGVGIVALIAFFRCETLVKNPVIDVKAFAGHPRLLATDAQFVLFNIVCYGIMFGIPALLEDKGRSAADAGLLMFPLAALTTIGTMVSVRLLRRMSVPKINLLCCAWSALGLIPLLVLSDATAIWAVIGVGLILGLPFGMASVAYQRAMVDHTPKDLAGVSAGLFQSARYTGGITASALIGLIFVAASTEHELRALIVVLLVISAVLALMLIAEPLSAARKANVSVKVLDHS
jgi:MFS family permease